MRHTITHDDLTIYVTYHGELKSTETDMLSQQVIKIVSHAKNPMNFIMDIREGHTSEIASILKSCAKLIPQMKKFNCCYIIGNESTSFRYTISFFKFLGAARDKVLLMDNINEAQIDIIRRWKKYKILNES